MFDVDSTMAKRRAYIISRFLQVTTNPVSNLSRGYVDSAQVIAPDLDIRLPAGRSCRLGELGIQHLVDLSDRNQACRRNRQGFRWGVRRVDY
jgi:hypothetical protein